MTDKEFVKYFNPATIEEALNSFENTDHEQFQDKIERFKQSADHFNSQRLFDIECVDLEDRIKIRLIYAKALLWLLFIQNLFVFGLVAYSIQKGNIYQLKEVFSIIIPATLTETVILVKIVVKWLFRDIDYTKHNYNGK